jgi:hypothetical protein
VPDLNHLWQRFLLASALLVGLAIGAAATVFGYSNLGTVNVRWSVFHIDGVPLWTVAVVPLAIFVIAGTIYHWVDGLHHFTEHMRHRRRVHELEAEVASLRAHLDQVLEMPDHSTSRLPQKRTSAPSLPAADAEIADPEHVEVVDVEPAKPVLVPTEAPTAIESPAKPAEGAVVAVSVAKPPSTRKGGHGASHRRATLATADKNGEPDRSGSHVEGTAAAGKRSERAARPAPEV